MAGEVKRKRRLPVREFVVSIGLIVVLGLLALPVIRTTRNAGPAPTCQGNLQKWGTIFAMYRSEHNNLNPLPHGFENFGPAANAAGCSNIDDRFDFAPELRAIFPDYAQDTVILACPDSPAYLPASTAGPVVLKAPRINPDVFKVAEGSCDAAGAITRPGASYTYLGYELRFANDRDPQVSREQALTANLPATGPASVVALLARFQVTEEKNYARAQASRPMGFLRAEYLTALGWPYVPGGGEMEQNPILPLNDSDSNPGISELGAGPSGSKERMPTTAVMWDAMFRDASGSPWFNHRGPDGCNVLYMDGHVEFKTFPGDFPVSSTFATMTSVP